MPFVKRNKCGNLVRIVRIGDIKKCASPCIYKRLYLDRKSLVHLIISLSMKFLVYWNSFVHLQTMIFVMCTQSLHNRKPSDFFWT